MRTTTINTITRFVSCLLVLIVVKTCPSVVSTSTFSCLPSPLLDQQATTKLHPDNVHYLPGYDQPLPSAWYSGYLTYDLYNNHSTTTIHTHYIFVEAEDNENGNKPIIYWSNGGPGASSLFGLFTEIGPLLLSDLSLMTDEYRSTGIPTPAYNKYTWTRFGHLLVFDQPAPVGFSYCNNNTSTDDDSHTSCDGILWNDELAAENVLLAMQSFYNKFPCLQSLDLYLAGESYAGIYIPTLAREILQYNNDTRTKVDRNNNNPIIKLKGFAVGDGCLGNETDICGRGPNNHNGYNLWHLLFLAGHGQIPFETLQATMEACQPYNTIHTLNTAGKLMYHLRTKDAEQMQNNKENEIIFDACQSALQKVQDQVGGVYAYALYDECIYRNGLLSSLISSSTFYQVDGALNEYPCGGEIVMEKMYLSLSSVRDAFHLQSKWFSVDNEPGFVYTKTERDLTKFYKSVVNDEQHNLKILIYNGDTDPMITSFVTQNWTSNLGFSLQEEWRPWTVDGCRRVGGYVTRYAGSFDFLTIRGAGHMVPTNKAAAAFAFMKSWIQDEDYPVYDKNCESPLIS